MTTRASTALLAVPLALAAGRGVSAAYKPAAIGKIVRIRHLPDVQRPHVAHPTTAELGNRERPDPDRVLPGGVRIHTRCSASLWCADGLSLRGKVLIPASPKGREQIIRVAWQDESFVSVYVAQSWYVAGAAHSNNLLQCRTFDLAAGKALKLGDVLGGGAARALARARRLLRSDDAEMQSLSPFKPTAAGFRFRRGKDGGRDVVLCAEGFYPSRSGELLEIAAR